MISFKFQFEWHAPGKEKIQKFYNTQRLRIITVFQQMEWFTEVTGHICNID